MSLGLVLSGGGARAAYQVGALSAIAEICRELKIENPIDYYTGLSAGAINAAMICADPHGSFTEATKKLVEIWSSLDSKKVYVSDPVSLSWGGLQWMFDLSLGGLVNRSPHRSLLDTSPLRKLLEDNCDFSNIAKNIHAGRFRALAVSALDYHTTSTITFLQDHGSIKPWSRVRRQAEATTITADHVLASASIPVLFPPVPIDTRYFGDGCVRNQSPCGPAIYMGANKLIAIGVRKKQDTCYTPPQNRPAQPPTVGRIANVLLNAVMMDGMELDIERLQSINANLAKFGHTKLPELSVRHIDALWIAPSRELSELASKNTGELPAMIRYLLKGLGSLQDASEISSFLLFDSCYSKALIELGYEDARKEKEALVKILTRSEEEKERSR
jgi:NTE family protein